MVTVWLTGGIGNQFFIYAASRQYGIRNRVSIRFDTTNYKYDFRSLELTKFNTKFIESTKWNKLFYRAKVQFIFKQLYRYFKFIPINIIENQAEVNLQIFGNNKNCYLQGYWQRNIYYEEIISLLKVELTLMDKYKCAIFYHIEDNIKNTNSVSIHVRRSDYLHEKNKAFFEVLDIEYYQKAVTYIKGKIQEPKYFVFTDDLEWVKENLFFNFSNIYFVSEIINDAAKEFELMRLCKYNITANSTFSWWAAYLNNFDNKIVIIPKLFYKNKQYQEQYEKGQLFQIENAVSL